MRKFFLYSFSLLLISLVACNEVSPEQQAAEAAKSYYDQLVEGYAEGFLEGKAGVDSLPADYCEQLLATHRQYLDDVRCKHNGFREVRISPNIARSDSILHVTYAFLLLCFGDSTQEEITVPMVEVNGEWKMR